ncbi:MAG: hypothetical protein FWC71_10155 [Defluviitaleaceae bacterium]|nr:hypothetical protein [Defluviitaleaceae bacterium]
MTKNDTRGELNDLRAIHDSGGVRIVFEWPQGEAFVRVVRTLANQPVASCNQLVANCHQLAGSIFTLDEYKQRGGYIPPRDVGRFTFQFPPYTNQLTCITARGCIRLQLCRKRGWGAWTTYVMKLYTDTSVPPGVLAYKKINAHRDAIGVSHSDMVYSFGESLHKGSTTRHILTKKNERLEFFIANEADRDIYELCTYHK